MPALNAALLIGIAAIAAGIVSGAMAPLRRWLLHLAVLDHPNARSLHQVPTPRGGGLAIAGVVGLAHGLVGAWLGVAGALDVRTFVVWTVVALGFAGLGWLDDRQPRSVRARLLVQGALATAFVVSAGVALPAGIAAAWIWPATIAAILVIVWTVNLYNFMDGADGVAALQALCTLAGALLIPGAAEATPVVVLSATLAGAVAGFLCWNWPPARLFMGDAGSYFVGFELAAFALIEHNGGGRPAVWLILFLPFAADATLTLFRRLLSGERWWTAHRSHAYQRLLLAGWPVRRLLAALALLNVFVCWPLAWWAAQVPAVAGYALGIGGIVVTALWIVAIVGTRTAR
jgi:Fuc2NAc and GlcNAc transferase